MLITAPGRRAGTALKAMELVVTTTTMEDMELVAPKAMKLVVTTAPGRRVGTALKAMELVAPKLVVVTTTYTVLALVTSPACKNTTFLGSFARRRGAGTFFK